MFRKLIYSGPLVCGLLPFKIFDNDKILRDSKTVQNAYLNKVEETGHDRLRQMFSIDEFGNVSPELNSALQVGFLGLFIGGLYGGINESKIAYLNFMDNNQATSFKSHLDAKRKLQDEVTRNFGKGAFKWGWRLGFFSYSYVFITTTISVYRGKSSIIEYLIGGGITGVLYKFTMGPRAMLVGGLLGTSLGAIGGAISLAVLKLAGVSMEEIRYWQFSFHEERKNKFSEAIKNYKMSKDLELMQEFNKNKLNKSPGLETISEETK